ncbi:MAG: hypothetical protein DRP89_04855 [Candidatus Neomarinimicrobiota bacterium]|nr:MAG: hypothetical protein DRP89_04855 [Candidatus Neomarinimicrobiota bacterium]
MGKNHILHRINKYKIFLTILLFVLIDCSNETTKFDGEIAFRYLEQQCALGVRNPGSPSHAAAKEMFVAFLTPLADTVIQQDFEWYIKPDDITFGMTNIIANFSMEKGNGLIIAAHWDTRPRAEHDPNPQNRDMPILGANDGASGIAVLMHLAEHLAEKKPERAVSLVFFDGEDYGFPGDLEYYCMGSEYFAKNLPIPKPAEAIVIDMIGDAELTIPVERNSYRSHPKLVETLWKIADHHGYSEFEHRIGEEIYDDHVPLIKYANIPSVDLIDFHYPNRFVNYWHTLQDTPDKCSPGSLEVVGQVLLDYIYSEK